MALGCGGGGGQGPSDPDPAPVPSAPPAVPAGSLVTSGNQILTSDGAPWMGRGVNIPDTRSCNACAYQSPDVNEVKRRIDEAVAWGASFLRLTLESYAQSNGRVHWRGVLDDGDYLADIQEIVAHVASKPGVYVMLSLWIDPSIDENGLPTSQSVVVWRRLAEVFREEPRVLFGVVNEPEANFDGSRDAVVWEAMNEVVTAIREVEDAAGTPNHLVAVQGTRQWARVLDYYVQRPISAKGGHNVVYETHVYDEATAFQARFIGPSRSLPVIIGEFGPFEWPRRRENDPAGLQRAHGSGGVPRGAVPGLEFPHAVQPEPAAGSQRRWVRRWDASSRHGMGRAAALQAASAVDAASPRGGRHEAPAGLGDRRGFNRCQGPGPVTTIGPTNDGAGAEPGR